MRYHGFVGYGVTAEVKPGVWKETIIEHEYYGEVLRNRTNIQQDNSVGVGIKINNTISIVADPFAYENYYSIRYVTYLGKKWKVRDIEIERPRMKLTIGDIYNE